jgi:uncharacterized protein (TIGR00251 family)
MMLKVREQGDAAVFTVKAMPGACKSEITGEHDGMLKVKVAAAPERGRANGELINFLSACLKIRKQQVEIIKGATSRAKTIKISGIKARDIRKLAEV